MYFHNIISETFNIISFPLTYIFKTNYLFIFTCLFYNNQVISIQFQV